MIFQNCQHGDRVSQCYHVPRCARQAPGLRLSAFGRWLPERADLTAYLTAKHAYERLVEQHAAGHKPGDPWPAEVTEAEAEVDRLKAAGGVAGPAGPLCCQRYGRLHEPVFSVGSCPWLGAAL